jgi:hypothetical protein
VRGDVAPQRRRHVARPNGCPEHDDVVLRRVVHRRQEVDGPLLQCLPCATQIAEDAAAIATIVELVDVGPEHGNDFAGEASCVTGARVIDDEGLGHRCVLTTVSDDTGHVAAVTYVDAAREAGEIGVWIVRIEAAPTTA